jgi:hypothetical protein
VGDQAVLAVDDDPAPPPPLVPPPPPAELPEKWATRRSSPSTTMFTGLDEPVAAPVQLLNLEPSAGIAKTFRGVPLRYE